MTAGQNLLVEEVYAFQDEYILVDVREPHELLGQEGFIKGSFLKPLGPALIQFLEKADPAKAYVFLCRSGVRSQKACQIAASFGFSQVYNMKGGMIAWNQSQASKSS